MTFVSKVYFAGVALLTAAAATEGVVPALVTSGVALLVYALCCILSDAMQY